MESIQAVIKKVKPSAPEGLLKSYQAFLDRYQGRDNYLGAAKRTTYQDTRIIVCVYLELSITHPNIRIRFAKSFVLRFAVVRADVPPKGCIDYII